MKLIYYVLNGLKQLGVKHMYTEDECCNECSVPEVEVPGETCKCSDTGDCCCDPAPAADPVVHSEYWNFLDELEGTMKAFLCEARAGDINKQAALRARKMSLTIGKSLKEYREVSVAHDKSHVRSRKKAELSKEIETLNG